MWFDGETALGNREAKRKPAGSTIIWGFQRRFEKFEVHFRRRNVNKVWDIFFVCCFVFGELNCDNGLLSLRIIIRMQDTFDNDIIQKKKRTKEKVHEIFCWILLHRT